MPAVRMGAFGRCTVAAALGAGVQPSYAAQVRDGHSSVSMQRFHDQMRELWDDHITYTPLAIVSFVQDWLAAQHR